MSSLAHQYDSQLNPLYYDGLSEVKFKVDNFVGKKLQEFLDLRNKSLDDYVFKQKKAPGLSSSFIKDVIEGVNEFRSIKDLEIISLAMHLSNGEKNELEMAFKQEEKAKNIPLKRLKLEVEAKKTAISMSNIPGRENLKKQSINAIFKNYREKSLALLINEVMLARDISPEEFFNKLKLKYPKDSIYMVLTGERIPFPRIVRIFCNVLDVDDYQEQMIYARNEDHKKKEEKKRN